MAKTLSPGATPSGFKLTDIPTGLAVLVGFDLLGDVIAHLSPIKAPGAVIGMVLLTLVLCLRKVEREDEDARGPLDRTADALIANMGWMFIPAGTGLIAQLVLLKASLAAILIAVIASTVLSLVATGWLMARFSPAPTGEALHESSDA